MAVRFWLAAVPGRPILFLNLTPLIDILLVLLVIFMAALPLAQKAIDSHIPAASQRPDEAPPGQIEVIVAAKGAGVDRVGIVTEAMKRSTGN